MAQNVMVYSTSTWSWCKKVKQLLDDNKVPYQALDVSSDRSAREEMVKKSGGLTVPVTDIDGDIIVGFEEAKLKQKLNLAG